MGGRREVGGQRSEGEVGRSKEGGRWELKGTKSHPNHTKKAAAKRSQFQPPGEPAQRASKGISDKRFCCELF